MGVRRGWGLGVRRGWGGSGCMRVSEEATAQVER